jgi:hypothetical protein
MKPGKIRTPLYVFPVGLKQDDEVQNQTIDILKGEQR